ncbi:MAG TPA: alpha/beta hydrolase [Acidimicrobiia bacterium]|nr:alpha/beta hydrolase [Acidimicrobiia bacterium]
MAATVVLVHGAWHGAWCWSKVIPRLDAAGVAVVAVDLPGHGDRPGPPGDLYEAAAHVREVLDTIDGPVVVCGHSYGGAVITEATADRADVTQLVYLAALLPDVGESVGATMPNAELDPAEVTELARDGAMIRHDDGTMTVDEKVAVAALYNDCTDEDVAYALPRLCAQSAASFKQTLTGAGWHDIPATYVVCTEDRAIVPGFQRAMARARATTIVELPAGHSPFFSDPQAVADLLAELARA